MTRDLDPFRSLASAALDNEVTADERDQVEADEDVQGVIRSYRAIAGQLRIVDVPESAREAAVAAALATFDASDAQGGTVLTLPDGLASRERRQRRERQYRWLGGVAAAAVVGVLGVAIMSSGSGSDSRMSASTDASVGSAAKSSPAAGAADAVDSFETAAAAESTPPALASTEIAAGTAADTAEAALGDPWAAAPELTNPDELRAYAATLNASAAPELSETSVVCSSPVGAPTPVLYKGERVYLARDTATDELTLLDATTCATVLRIPAG